MNINIPELRGLVGIDAQPGQYAVRLLTHAHADHLPPTGGPLLLASPITLRLLPLLRPSLTFTRTLAVRPGEPTLVPLAADHMLSVTALEANHCAGSVMFLIESERCGRVLYTGDVRFEEEEDEGAGGQALGEQEAPAPAALPSASGAWCAADRLYLDTTFFDPLRWPRFPPRRQAVAQVLALVRRHAPDGSGVAVYLEADMLGCEPLLLALARAFLTPLHVVDPRKLDMFAALDPLRPLLTPDAAASRFHVCQFQSFAFATSSSSSSSSSLSLVSAPARPAGLYIRPSTQWFGLQENARAAADPSRPWLAGGVWHVLFAMHGSFAETVRLVRHLRPRSLVPLCPAACAHGALQRAFPDLLAAAAASPSASPVPAGAAAAPSSTSQAPATTRRSFSLDAQSRALDDAAMRRAQSAPAAAAAVEAAASPGHGPLDAQRLALLELGLAHTPRRPRKAGAGSALRLRLRLTLDDDEEDDLEDYFVAKRRRPAADTEHQAGWAGSDA